MSFDTPFKNLIIGVLIMLVAVFSTLILGKSVWYVALAIVSMALIVFVHESGHFLAGKLLGVKVDEFMIGLPLGPKLFKRKIGETEYGITASLFGGYVKFAGEELKPEEEMEEVSEEEKKRRFNTQPFWKKSLIILAGGLMMFVFAIFLGILILMRGVPTPTTTIEQVMAKTPAAHAGIRAGDKIIAVNQKKVQDWDEVTAVIHKNPNKSIDLDIQRGDRLIHFKVKLTSRKNSLGYLGIQSKLAKKRYGFFEAAYIATTETYRATKFIVTALGELFLVPQKLLSQGRSPIGIVVETTKAAQGGIDYFLQFLAFLNISLAIVNFLPIPPLDGGQLLVFLFERLRNRPITYEQKIAINLAGLTVVLFLFVYFILADIWRYGPQVIQLFIDRARF